MNASENLGAKPAIPPGTWSSASRFGALAAPTIVAGCSGGSGPAAPGPLPATSVAVPAAPRAHVTFSVGSPVVTAAKALHPLYVSRGMKSLAITVRTASSLDSRLVFPCPGSCTGSLDAPVGQDTLLITDLDCTDGTGNTLSTGMTSVNVRSGVANSFSVVLGGIVAKLALSLAPSAFTSGTPANGTLNVVPPDASGNTIVGPDAFRLARDRIAHQWRIHPRHDRHQRSEPGVDSELL